MKPYMLVLLIAIATQSFAQKCKYDKNENDPTIGKWIKKTETKTFFNVGYMICYMSVRKIGDKYDLIFRCNKEGAKSVAIKEGSELKFVLENGKSISLKKTDGLIPISLSDLKALSESRTQSFIFFVDEEKDIKIKKSSADRFMNLIKCVL